jgi:hypothetical protein
MSGDIFHSSSLNFVAFSAVAYFIHKLRVTNLLFNNHLISALGCLNHYAENNFIKARLNKYRNAFKTPTTERKIKAKACQANHFCFIIFVKKFWCLVIEKRTF